jgi:hypothetical protein
VLALLAGGSAVDLDQAFDVQLLQTSASVENAIVAAYDALLALPILSAPTANAVLRAAVTTARAHHADHATACNSITTKLGGKAQTGANGALSQVAAKAKPTLTDLAPTLDFALQLETVAAQTYQNVVGLLADVNGRRLAASILGVEAQHVAFLQVMRSVVGLHMPELISLDAGTGAKLPADAVTAGFPAPIAKTDQARPPTEGAVK